MTNVAMQPSVIEIPEVPVEERIKYLTEDMIYNEEELAFIRTRREVQKRSIERINESIARTNESIARTDEILTKGKESIKETWDFIEELEKKYGIK